MFPRSYSTLDLFMEMSAPPDLILDLNKPPLEELPTDNELFVHPNSGSPYD